VAPDSLLQQIGTMNVLGTAAVICLGYFVYLVFAFRSNLYRLRSVCSSYLLLECRGTEAPTGESTQAGSLSSCYYALHHSLVGWRLHGRTELVSEGIGYSIRYTIVRQYSLDPAVVTHYYLIDQLPTVYERIGRNAFITLPLFPAGSLTAFIGDAEVMKEILNDRARFPKPTHQMTVVNVFGLVCLFQTMSETTCWLRFVGL
jgi:hypothetical protein